MGIVCMLGMQIKARDETIEDCARRRAKLFIETLRDQTQTKQILEELANKQNRDKLWKIYLDKTNTNKDKLKRDEILRIRNIEKQLAAINRNRLIMDDIFVPPVMKHCIRRIQSDSRSTIIPKLPSIENQSRTRRRSSLDQQIIERWKSIVDQSKGQEQLPWPIKKGLIRRYFRRYYKNSLKEFKQINPTTTDSPLNNEHLESNDDEQCHLLPTYKKQINNNSRQLTRKSNERLNPYITYFHLPINENFKSNIQDFPLVTIKSDHHIIEMNHDEC